MNSYEKRQAINTLIRRTRKIRQKFDDPELEVNFEEVILSLKEILEEIADNRSHSARIKREAVLLYQESELKLKVIAHRLGVTTMSIRRWNRKAGFPDRNKKVATTLPGCNE